VSTRTSLTVKEARSKGMKAGLALIVTAFAYIYLWSFLWLPVLGYTCYLTYQWLMFRGKYGMRF
jgi:hypothetical protein